MNRDHYGVPIGVEDFKILIDRNYYYADKTDFIVDTIPDMVTFYIQPSGFGKTLNLSMLKYFYSIQEKDNAYLFNGLKISRFEKAKAHQNRYPVIFLSFKDVNGKSFESALYAFSGIIRELLNTYPELLDSDKLNEDEKADLQILWRGTLDSELLADSLCFLSQCLYRQYGEKVIILLDDYDVPVYASNTIIDFIRSFLSRALKTNDALEKAIVTGCLPVSQELIFPGLNHFRVNSVIKNRSSAAFGFTRQEAEEIFASYGFSGKFALVGKWYGGYRFGNRDIYNPWSILRYMKDLLEDPDAEPLTYWTHPSFDSYLLYCIQNGHLKLLSEFQSLIDGKSVMKKINTCLPYRELESPENMYSFLLLTGYLKLVSKRKDNVYELAIPNLEVRKIFEIALAGCFQNP